jgi:hypothetical protein
LGYILKQAQQIHSSGWQILRQQFLLVGLQQQRFHQGC